MGGHTQVVTAGPRRGATAPLPPLPPPGPARPEGAAADPRRRRGREGRGRPGPPPPPPPPPPHGARPGAAGAETKGGGGGGSWWERSAPAERPVQLPVQLPVCTVQLPVQLPVCPAHPHCARGSRRGFQFIPQFAQRTPKPLRLPPFSQCPPMDPRCTLRFPHCATEQLRAVPSLPSGPPPVSQCAPTPPGTTLSPRPPNLGAEGARGGRRRPLT